MIAWFLSSPIRYIGFYHRENYIFFVITIFNDSHDDDDDNISIEARIHKVNGEN